MSSSAVSKLLIGWNWGGHRVGAPAVQWQDDARTEGGSGRREVQHRLRHLVGGQQAPQWLHSLPDLAHLRRMVHAK